MVYSFYKIQPVWSQIIIIFFFSFLFLGPGLKYT